MSVAHFVVEDTKLPLVLHRRKNIPFKGVIILVIVSYG